MLDDYTDLSQNYPQANVGTDPYRIIDPSGMHGNDGISQLRSGQQSLPRPNNALGPNQKVDPSLPMIGAGFVKCDECTPSSGNAFADDPYSAIARGQNLYSSQQSKPEIHCNINIDPSAASTMNSALPQIPTNMLLPCPIKKYELNVLDNKVESECDGDIDLFNQTPPFSFQLFQRESSMDTLNIGNNLFVSKPSTAEPHTMNNGSLPKEFESYPNNKLVHRDRNKNNTFNIDVNSNIPPSTDNTQTLYDAVKAPFKTNINGNMSINYDVHNDFIASDIGNNRNNNKRRYDMIREDTEEISEEYGYDATNDNNKMKRQKLNSVVEMMKYFSKEFCLNPSAMNIWFKYEAKLKKNGKECDKKYVCPWKGCNAGPYGSSAHLKRHFKEKHAEFKYQCTYNGCSKKPYAQRGNLKKHMETIHLKIKWQCPQCGTKCAYANKSRHKRTCKANNNIE